MIGQFGQATARGAVGSVLTQGVAVATGLQDRFDWTSVAVSAVTAGVGQAVGGVLPDSLTGDARGFVAGLVGGAAGAGARSLIQGTSFGDNLMAALPDIIGQTIGNMVAGGIQTQAATRNSASSLEDQLHESFALRGDRDDEVLWPRGDGSVGMGPSNGSGGTGSTGTSRARFERYVTADGSAPIAPSVNGRRQTFVQQTDAHEVINSRLVDVAGVGINVVVTVDVGAQWTMLDPIPRGDQLFYVFQDLNTKAISPEILAGGPAVHWDAMNMDVSFQSLYIDRDYAVTMAALTSIATAADNNIDGFVDTVRHPVQAGQRFVSDAVGFARLIGGLATSQDTRAAFADSVRAEGHQIAEAGRNRTLDMYAAERAGSFLPPPDVLGAVIPLAALRRAGGVAHAAESVPLRAGEVFGPPSFSPGAGKSYFWSGLGPGGANTAGGVARSGGGTTLEMFIESRGIQMPVWDAANPASIKAWNDVSRVYAGGASGEVRAVLGNNLRPGNTWQTVELPALQANPNVTRIITVNPTIKAETVFWSR